MRIYIFVIMLFMMTACSHANVIYDNDTKMWVNYNDVINKTAHMLGTPRDIDWYVESTTIYHFSFFKRDEYVFWTTKQGDCTDKAILKCKMINDIGIKCRTVHGYSWSDGNMGMHDWYEYYEDNEWKTYDYIYFDKEEKIGNGIW